MPLDLNELRANRVKLDIPEFPTLQCFHNPLSYTPEFEAKVKALDVKTLGSDFLCATLPSLIAEWDLVDNGQPVPVTTEALRTLPIELLVCISKAINEVHVPFGQTKSEESTDVS